MEYLGKENLIGGVQLESPGEYNSNREGSGAHGQPESKNQNTDCADSEDFHGFRKPCTIRVNPPAPRYPCSKEPNASNQNFVGPLLS